MNSHQSTAMALLRHLLYRWEEEMNKDLWCPIESCEFQTDGPKEGGSGFVTLEMYIHLTTDQKEEDLAGALP